MEFLFISDYPDPNPDNSLQYKNVPEEFETEVLSAMGWQSLADVPVDENDPTSEQAVAILRALGETGQV
ncbi:pyocin S6 family toxin immunity protein [Pseudomonas syringae]|jgi:hypothetical protein|uniref:Uncharacterized protein n=1 Tax=Pseudomonas syringae TaxID=317 RepID=A0A085V2L1_PSESX|nr:pyocin S6 family toxin immunity protein [Pseudomonas syringae]KFE49674.1 hypothetical protein IV02_18960 [Pseudomonas syringae]